MMQIDLQPVPNQSFSVTLDGARYDLTLKECGGAMCADVTRDEVVLLQGQLVVAGSPLIPYRYLESGNFAILTEADELPYYDQFGVTQFLVYASPDELASVRG